MKIEYLFLDLFRNFVREEKNTYPGVSMTAEDWQKLYQLSAYHQIIPIIYEAASQMEAWNVNPPEWFGSWKRETMMAVGRQIHMTSEFVRLYGELQKRGISPLVVKGLVCRSLYPKPDYRMSGDEDILIRREEFWAVDAFLTEQGFFKMESDEELREKMENLHEVGYRHPKTGVYLEIHLSLFPEESGAYGHFNGLFSKLHKESLWLEVEGGRIATLNATEHFLYLLCHSAKHFLHSGFGVRQVFDMILFAEQYGAQMDWNWILEKTRECHMDIFLYHLLDIGVRYFAFDPKMAGWPEEAMTLDGTLDSADLLEDLLVGGVFGASSEERIHSSNITLAAANQEEKVNGIWASLFPKRSYMEQKFHYVKAHPWLLPIGWIHRIGQYAFRRKMSDNKKVVETGNKRVKMLKKYGMID